MLHLYCLSRSTQPQNDLLEEIYRQQAQEERDETAVYRPWGQGRSRWSFVTYKAVRPIDTVVLEDDQKSAIISDIEEYLKPETRDILAMAIAGQFGLKIYMVSLLDIGDSDLMELLQNLPSTGCLLLLEDIDSSGLDRKLRRQAKATANSETPPEAEDEQQVSKVTLSGFLNAIDGISSPEGHVLIMTTNTPEKQDSALIRSGRISVRVAFACATQSQAQDIFLRQYQTEDIHSDEVSKHVRKLVSPKRKLPAMAAAFARKVPENEFTPADLQDYLITHKDEPQEAVDQFEEFRTKILEERRHLTEEREAGRKKEREARATEASKQAEASAFAMAKALSAVSSGLAGSNWRGMKFW